MYPVRTRVLIVGGFFCSNEAKELARSRNIRDFRPTGTVVYAKHLEHRVELDQALSDINLVTRLSIEDLQLITPKHRISSSSVEKKKDEQEKQ